MRALLLAYKYYMRGVFFSFFHVLSSSVITNHPYLKYTLLFFTKTLSISKGGFGFPVGEFEL